METTQWLPPSPCSYGDPKNPDGDLTADGVHTPAKHIIALGLDDTPGGGRVVEEETATGGQAGSEKATSWIECVRSSAASGGMQGMLRYPPESEINEAVDLEDVYS